MAADSLRLSIILTIVGPVDSGGGPPLLIHSSVKFHAAQSTFESADLVEFWLHEVQRQ